MTHAARTARTLAVTVLLAGALAGGCTGPRPLHIVREQADRAFEDGQYESALNDYTEFVERYPGDPMARLQLARTYMALGQPRKGSEQLAIAYNVEPQNEQIIDAMCDAQYQSGDRDGLMSFLRRLCNERGTVNDYLRFGDYSSRLGNADEAVVAFKTAARLDQGRHVRPQMALADFYASVNDRDGALRRLRMAHYIDPLNQRVIEKIRAYGEIPGPTFAMQPEEAVAPAP